jgi:competence protein ComEC
VFVIGLALALRFGGPAGTVTSMALFGGAAAVAGLVIGASAREAPRRMVLLVFALLGLGMGVRAHHDMGTDCRLGLQDGSPVRVAGVLESSHFGAGEDGRVPLLPFRVAELAADGRAIAGCTPVLRVRLPRSFPEVPAGTRLGISGEWIRSPPPLLPSAWPADPRWAGWMAGDSAVLVAQAASAGFPLLRMRGRSEARLRSLVPAHPALVEALVLGRRERLDPAVRERFARAGLAHLLAISGMHVGILTGVLLLLGRVARLPRRWTAAVTMTAVGAYLLFIGAPPSAVRAGTMISLALIAMRLQRPFEPLGVMVAAAFGILFLRPAALLDPGFQLSFGGVIGILVARRTVLHRLPGSVRSIRGAQWLSESIVVSGAAFVATAPIVAWHFGMLAPVAVLANLPAVPLLGLALVGILAAATAAPFSGGTGELFAGAASAMLDLLGQVADVAAAVPLGHGWVSRPQAVVSTLAIAAAAAMYSLLNRSGRRLRIVGAAGAISAVFLATPVVTSGIGPGKELQIHVLDVGQGDAIAIRSPAGRWVLIDAGPSDDRFNAGERRILPFLRAHGVQRLEAVILTHPHRDHIGGAAPILRTLEIGRLIEPGHAFGSHVYLETLRSAEEQGIPWVAARSGRSLRLDGMELAFLWPDEQAMAAVEDVNEISVVVHLRFGPFSALFTGDAYDATELELVRRHGVGLRSHLLKAGHHGSYTSTSPQLLDAVRPELVVISAGRRNRFGHPAPEVLRELRGRDLRVARTDRDGTITIRVDTARAGLWRIEVP